MIKSLLSGSMVDRYKDDIESIDKMFVRNILFRGFRFDAEKKQLIAMFYATVSNTETMGVNEELGEVDFVFLGESDEDIQAMIASITDTVNITDTLIITDFPAYHRYIIVDIATRIPDTDYYSYFGYNDTSREPMNLIMEKKWFYFISNIQDRIYNGYMVTNKVNNPDHLTTNDIRTIKVDTLNCYIKKMYVPPIHTNILGKTKEEAVACTLELEEKSNGTLLFLTVEVRADLISKEALQLNDDIITRNNEEILTDYAEYCTDDFLTSKGAQYQNGFFIKDSFSAIYKSEFSHRFDRSLIREVFPVAKDIWHQTDYIEIIATDYHDLLSRIKEILTGN